MGAFRLHNIKLVYNEGEYSLLFPQETYWKRSGKKKVETIIEVDKDFKDVLLEEIVKYYLFFTGKGEKPENAEV